MKGAKWIIYIMSVYMLTGFVSTELMAAETKLIPLYTAAAGGPSYMLGAGIASLTKKYVPGIEMVAEATPGSLPMVKNLREREGMKKEGFAIIASDGAFNAYHGKKDFEGKAYPSIRGITFLFGGPQFLAVPASSSIRSYADVRGKRIAIGGPGSTLAESTLALLELYGIKRSDFKPYFFGYVEAANGIRDGSLDGGILADVQYMELSLTQNVRVVPADEEVLKKLVTLYPYYPYTVFKPGSYKGVVQDSPAITFVVAFYTHAGVSTDVVYQITRSLFEHREEFYQVHKFAKMMTPETALKGIPIPLHPGAEKYFRESGVIKN